MTAKTETVRARISPELKHNVQEILDKLGLSITEAINMYFKQIEMNQGLPFEAKIPNKETRKAIEDGTMAINGKSFDTIEELFKDLEN
ncbi:MAG TPA: type II toxin-antitoxin system RelB/DinJ family antitoxin [Candidatus Gastranaerophilales bacterium]|nr:type II toxin-antitoxin system RelB/DinJ family antitoxin [Candidatus Gastranaerophilales bacterium]